MFKSKMFDLDLKCPCWTNNFQINEQLLSNLSCHQILLDLFLNLILVFHLCHLRSNFSKLFFSIYQPGLTTDEIDEFVHNETIAANAYPSPLRYAMFPKSVCTSVNNVACHGIPDDRPLVDGDIINIDITVRKTCFFTRIDKFFLFLLNLLKFLHYFIRRFSIMVITATVRKRF